MPLQVIVRGKEESLKKSTFNLDPHHTLRLRKQGEEIVKRSFYRTHKGKGTGLIITPNGGKIPDEEITRRGMLLIDTFQIMYAELKMNFIRCMDRLEEVFNRRLDDPNWDVKEHEMTGFYAAPENECHPQGEGDVDEEP